MEESVKNAKGLGIFEKYLTLWVGLCIVGGIVLGKLVPGLAAQLDRMAIYVDEAPVVSIPIAVCLFLMMYPIMVKIDFAEVLKAGNRYMRRRCPRGQLAYQTVHDVRDIPALSRNALPHVHRPR